MIGHIAVVEISGGVDLSGPERVQRQREYARQALVECAGRCGAPQIGWEQAPSGAPLPNEGWYWSISHKPKMVAAVISREPVGIDVELLQPRRSTGLFLKLATPAEWALVGITNSELRIAKEDAAPEEDPHTGLLNNRVPSPESLVPSPQSPVPYIWHCFFRFWTAKEATLKANGKGIGEFDNCRIVEVVDDGHIRLEYQSHLWTTEHCDYRNHLITVTTGHDPVNWHFYE